MPIYNCEQVFTLCLNMTIHGYRSENKHHILNRFEILKFIKSIFHILKIRQLQIRGHVPCYADLLNPDYFSISNYVYC